MESVADSGPMAARLDRQEDHRLMPRKVILDMDPGFDDAVALALALASPALEVLAVTATGGNVPPEQATRNVQALVEQLDPPRRPRMGAASSDQILLADARHIHGADGLCGAQFKVAELANQHTSLKLLADEVRKSPNEVTIVATGPLTNIADLLRAEPDIASMIGHLIILGGTVASPGNITATSEFNIYCDAESARNVFRSPVTKTIVPIDVTSQVTFGFELLDHLKRNPGRTSNLLLAILPGALRNCRQRLGIEGIHIHDAFAIAAALQPGLFTTEPMHGDVETSGDLTHGMTVFDRRAHSEEQPNMDVATDVDAAAVEALVLKLLAGAS